jgi:pimeloyl-ACP methyl ester carboxylesterase
MLVRAFAGTSRKAPYNLDDLAADAFGLLDHLGIERAHLAGVSMGGMIVQTMAIRHPDRVASLVSIMSTTGRRSVGWQDPRLLPMLLAPRQRDRAAYVASSARMWQMIGSPGFPADREKGDARAAETYDRGISGPGILRQMLAVLTQPNRSKALAGLRIPTTVIHGTHDRMVHSSGGRATARAVPGAELLLIDGMGHDVPEDLYEVISDAIRRTADRSR